MNIYQWQPDLPDQRDHLYATVMAASNVPVSSLPKSVDLRPLCSPVEDQGQLGSCTGNAIVGAMELLENVHQNGKFVDLSRLFVYYNERVIEGTVRQDAGAQIRDGIKSVATKGVCVESLCPYNIARFTRAPSAKAVADAATRKATAYQRVSSLDELKHALAGARPVVFGFTVYDSFESATVAKTGVMPMPAKTEKPLGGHAVLCVGYDDVKQVVLVRNSWGKDWGMGGYFTMPYAFISNPNLCDDFWCIQA